MQTSLAKSMAIFSALRHRNYRLYWIGLMVAITGYQVQSFVQLWLVYELTRSPFYLGLVGGASAASTITFTLFGGVLADRVDRRRLLMLTQTCSGVLTLILATLAITNVLTVWHILVIAALQGIVGAFDSPVRHALLPHLIDDRKDLMNAVAMVSVVWQSTRIIGPALAGVLISVIGAAWCLYFAAFAFFTMTIVLSRIKLGEGTVPKESLSLWNSFQQGFDYVRHSSLIASLIGMTFLNSVFGLSFIYLMPIFAGDILKVGSGGYGFLMASLGVGGLVGIAATANMGGVKGKGWLLLIGSALFGILLVLFAFSRVYSLSLVLIALASIANYIYMITVQTLLQIIVPDQLRGRVMGIYSMTWSLQPLGSVQSGAIAELLGAPVAVAIGGLVVTAFALFMMAASPVVRKVRL